MSDDDNPIRGTFPAFRRQNVRDYVAVPEAEYRTLTSELESHKRALRDLATMLTSVGQYGLAKFASDALLGEGAEKEDSDG